jgi:hypothetical protein
MKYGAVIVGLACALALPGETAQDRGRKIINDCLQALGGDRFEMMQNRVETGRAYSFYNQNLTGLSIATIYTRYDSGVRDSERELAQHERENFGKKQDYGVLFGAHDAWDITYRGARPLPKDTYSRYTETTLRDIFYILRVRLHEPGLIFESKGADVLLNVPVEIVDITDVENRTTTVYIHQTTKLPVREVFYRRDPVTKDRIEEVAVFTKYRDVDGIQWPFTIERERNGEKVYQMFSDSVEVNSPKASDALFALPASIKMLKAQ